MRYNKKRPYVDQPDEYKLIPLTKGQLAKVSNEDFDRLMQFNWYAHKDHGDQYYAERKQAVGGKEVLTTLASVVLYLPPGTLVDHISGDPLDNRRENLRIASKAQNNINIRMHADNKSGYKGVYRDKRNGSWIASIMREGKKKHLGCFDCPIKASDAYQTEAETLHGEWRRTA